MYACTLQTHFTTSCTLIIFMFLFLFHWIFDIRHIASSVKQYHHCCVCVCAYWWFWGSSWKFIFVSFFSHFKRTTWKWNHHQHSNESRSACIISVHVRITYPSLNKFNSIWIKIYISNKSRLTCSPYKCVDVQNVILFQLQVYFRMYD